MKRPRVNVVRFKRSSNESSRQLALPIGNTTAEKIGNARSRSGSSSVRRARASVLTDQILTTADVVRITQKHRTTLYRWIERGWFPPKAIRNGHAVGWLKSDIDRYFAGSAVVRARGSRRTRQSRT